MRLCERAFIRICIRAERARRTEPEEDPNAKVNDNAIIDFSLQDSRYDQPRTVERENRLFSFQITSSLIVAL